MAATDFAKQLAWEREEEFFFRNLGAALRDVLPHEQWAEFNLDERCRRVEAARDLLHREMCVKRPALVLWTDDPQNEGAGYDETSEDGDIHYPRHHLVGSEPEHIVRGLAEEMRHAWQDDVRRGLTRHPLGGIGKRAIEQAFDNYDESDPRTQTTNLLETDAKERAEWCFEGYLAN